MSVEDTSPSCVLATDKQLCDLQRFCTHPGNFCVLGIDPTFKLGKFCYHNNLHRFAPGEQKNPCVTHIFWCYISAHREELLEAYYHFFTTLLKLEPKLAGICASGTDGEEALIKALRTGFSEDLILLRCFIHMKDSLRHKLTEMLIPEKYREEIFSECSKEMFTPKDYLMPVTLKTLIEGLAISRKAG